MPLTLDQLRAVDAVLTWGSYRNAAPHLNKVPSAVGYSIRKLEEALGTPIFDRRPGSPGLAVGARDLIDLARSILRQVDQMERIAADMAMGWEPELRVVMDGALPMEPVLGCLRRFGDPNVRTPLRLEVAYQEDVIERFEGGADIALVLGLAEDGMDDDLEAYALPPLEMVLVAIDEHPLCNTIHQMHERVHYPEVVVRDSASKLRERSKGSFLESRNVVFMPDFHMKRQAILAGAGWGWMPEHLIAEDLAEKRLHPLATWFGDPKRWTYHPQLVNRRSSVGVGATLFLTTLIGFYEGDGS